MTEKERELFDEWKRRGIHQGKLFNCDGIVNIDVWEKEDCRILYLLKEAWHRETVDGSEYDLADELRKYGPWKMWNRVAEWTCGIHLTAEERPASYCELTKEDANLELQKIAVINIKKSGGESRSKDDDLMEYAVTDSDLIYKQIEMVNPTVIVCGYTFDFLNKVIELNDGAPIDKIGKNRCDNWHYKWKDRIVLDYYHPAYQVPALMAYYGIVGCFKDALENEAKGE